MTGEGTVCAETKEGRESGSYVCGVVPGDRGLQGEAVLCAEPGGYPWPWAAGGVAGWGAMQEGLEVAPRGSTLETPVCTMACESCQWGGLVRLC